MVDLLTLQKDFITPHLKQGHVACDFTMGNGNDTLWLSRAMGENGMVYAFDIQELALINTRARLESENAPNNYTLILDSHSNLKEYVKEPICVGMFNLGYLPGSGNKALTTLRESTRKAVTDAIDMLDHDGILMIAVYPGHEEGALEGEMLDEYLRTFDRRKICVSRFQIVNSPTSPFFFIVERK